MSCRPNAFAENEPTGAVNWDTDTLKAGAGWIFPVTEQTSIDLSAQLRQDDVKVSAGGFASESDDLNGYGAAVGFRSNLTDGLELFGRLGYLDGDYEGAVTADIGILISFTDNIGLSISYDYLDFDDRGAELELSLAQLGARWQF